MHLIKAISKEITVRYIKPGRKLCGFCNEKSFKNKDVDVAQSSFCTEAKRGDFY